MAFLSFFSLISPYIAGIKSKRWDAHRSEHAQSGIHDLSMIRLYSRSRRRAASSLAPASHRVPAPRPVVAGEQIAQTGGKSCSLPRLRENTVIRMQKERTKARSCFLSRSSSRSSLYGRDLRVVWYGGSRLWGHRVICLLPSPFGQRVCSSRL